jgi:hypothetical protein
MTIHCTDYCEIPSEVIKKPRCLGTNKLILESGNKIRTIWRTVKLETGEYSTEEENKPVMLYANAIQHLENLRHLVSVLLNSYTVYQDCIVIAQMQQST